MRFAKLERKRIDLGNSEWVEVRRTLSAGEDRRYRTAGMERMRSQEGESPSIDVDWEKMAFARATAYILDWCVFDDTGKPVKFTPSALAALEPAEFERIDKAIEAHIAEEAEAKKATDGDSGPTPPSA